MNPIAFRIPIPFLDATLEFTWYGISIVIGVLVATLYAAYAAKRKGVDPNVVWDMFIYVLVTGVIGARIWFVVTTTLGGNHYYLQNPLEILNIRAGGTNIFGAIIFGIAAVIVYCRIRNVNPWMYLDFLGPGVLLGQAASRWGNYINQELYGPPTTLPWGISIDAMHRIPPYHDLARYPLSARFHPTFLYETIYNLVAFGLLMVLLRSFGSWWKTGSVFGAYLVLHGIGRFIIEYFRPDQPLIGATDISFSRLLAVLFVVLGLALIYLFQYRTQAAVVGEGMELDSPAAGEESPKIVGESPVEAADSSPQGEERRENERQQPISSPDNP